MIIIIIIVVVLCKLSTYVENSSLLIILGRCLLYEMMRRVHFNWAHVNRTTIFKVVIAS